MDCHRSRFYELIDGRAADVTNDEYNLGIHLLDHGFNKHDDFDKIFNVFILENCSPRELEIKEFKYIHTLKSLRPHGMNTLNPFGLKLFHAY